MRALVIFESMFGDTRTVAEQVAAGIGAEFSAALADEAAGSPAEVSLLEVSQAPTAVPEGWDLLVLGAPTHAFGLSRPTTREDAAKKTDAELVSTGIGIREWLAAASVTKGQPAAVFDTRMDHPKALVKLDHASHTMAKALRKSGARLVADAQAFIVVDTTGPLAPGEAERAHAWGRALAKAAADAQ